ncbi:MAG TPA: hypothetical protein HPQ00_16550 [Magnetococcales bacterium]|nr:hypothetical protein [Magnetococcales bacterium]
MNMIKSPVKNRTSVSLLACAALMTVSLVAPQKAHADIATATVLGGLALFTTLMHASEPAAPPVAIAYPQASVPPPVMMAQPMAMPMPVLSPIHQPMVYSSVSPTVAPAPMVQQIQPISYQVSAPSAPMMNVPSYQSGPSPVYQQQSYQQPYPTGGMPVAYQQQQQGYPVMQQAAMMPQQQGVSYQTMPQQGMSYQAMPQQGMMPQQQTAMMQPQGMMPQGGYGASMPSTNFAYARQ